MKIESGMMEPVRMILSSSDCAWFLLCQIGLEEGGRELTEVRLIGCRSGKGRVFACGLELEATESFGCCDGNGHFLSHHR
jgi:hypothetical protein